MTTATNLVIEVDGQVEKTLALRTPRTLGELWAMFTKLGQRPTMIAMAGNSTTARVSF